MAKIIATHPEISADWIMTGQGPMLSQDNVYVTNNRVVTYDLKIFEGRDTDGVPLYNMPVSAGDLGVVDIGREEPTLYIKLPVFRDCKAIFPVVGISMEPDIRSGDLVGVVEIEPPFKWEYINTTRIYLIVTRSDRMIKYIKDAIHPEYIVCESPNASPFRVEKAEILQIYQVRAWAHRAF